MIDSFILYKHTREYGNACKRSHLKPSYKGLATKLNVSPQTIANVVNGLYNGKPYGNEPHATRCIDNKDFDVIRDVFSKKYEVYRKK